MIEEKARLRLEQPHFNAICRDGSAWAIEMAGLPTFLSSWKRGMAFWVGFNVWGEESTIKLADITGVSVRTEESIALREEEREEEKRREITS